MIQNNMWNFPTVTAPEYCVSLSGILLFHCWNYPPNLLVGLLFRYGQWSIHTALLRALFVRLKNPRKQKGISPRNFFPRWHNFELLLEKQHECDIQCLPSLLKCKLFYLPAILFLEKCITLHQGFRKISLGFRQPPRCLVFGILDPL